ncbi:MAG: AAA family ATPase [Myxococcales bacterium]|nr:AAA family ATPase [Myxococcales bacterium]
MGKKSKHIDIDDWIDADLTAAAKADALPPAFEVHDALRQVEEVVLAGGGARSPVLVGEHGVGKSAVLHQIVRRAARGEGPSILHGARVVQFGLRTLAGRFPQPGEATDFAQRFFDALLAAEPPVVPLIRDLHAAYGLDWEGLLLRYLARSPRPILAEALPQPLDELLDYAGELGDHLVAIRLDEPPPERVARVVSKWDAWAAAAQDRPAFDADGRAIAIELTGRFMGDRHFPRKVIDLLQQTRLLAPPDAPALGVAEIVGRFSQLTRVPSSLVDPRVPLDLDDVHGFLAGRLLGQDEAVDAILRMIALIKAGLTDLRRPFGVLLFVGPTGVGKTHAAQLLADYLFGDRHRLVRLNMADYPGPDDTDELFGNPYAPSVAQRRGVLTQRLVGHPFGVLLLDEFEKAHPRVHDRFLQLFDEGRFINGAGETISAASMIIIATSNAGVEVYREAGLGFQRPRDVRALDAELDRRLLQVFRFEFLNRFDHVVHFHPLDRAHIRQIARRELSELTQREGMARRHLALEVGSEVLDWLVAHGYHPHFGARFLRREIERRVTASLADFLVRHDPPKGARLGLTVRRDRVVVERLDVEPAAPVPTVDGHQRTLDADALRAEAAEWLARFEALESEAERRADEAARLMERSQHPGFWDDAEQAQAMLTRYRALDARQQAEARLRRPVKRLASLLEGQPAVEVLAEVVGDVALSYRRWLDLGADDAPAAAWVLIGPGDTHRAPGDWLRDLTQMYLAWARRQGLTAEVVAEQQVQGEVERVVLEVDGPRAFKVLEMEHGQHRCKLSNGGTARLRVEVLPRGDLEPSDALPTGVHVEDARRAQGLLVPRRAARLLFECEPRGISWILLGADPRTLTLLGRDLHAWYRGQDRTPEVARTYGITGGAVRDPRTGASSANLKDVLRGNLESFLRAWEQR